MADIELVIKIPEEQKKMVDAIVELPPQVENDLISAIRHGKPLPEYMKELKRRLLMEVDGGTDDRYLRYADVCDRISSTIDTYIKTESEDVLSKLDRSMECVLESDHRSFANRETETGWLFDTIIEWRKMIQPYIKESEDA